MKIIGVNSLWCLVLVLAFFSINGIAKEANIDSNIRSKNSEIQRLVNEKRDTVLVIEKIKNNEYRVLELLKVIGENISKTQNKIKELSFNKDKVLDDIKQSKAKIDYLSQLIKKDKLSIQKKLHVIFYIKKTRELTPILGLKTFENYYRNKYLIEKSASIGAELLEKYQSNQSQLIVQKNNLDIQYAGYVTYLSQEEEQKELLKFEHNQQAIYLNHIQNDETIRTKYLREIQIEIEKLNDVIFKLEHKKTNEKKVVKFQGFRKRRNDLPLPVNGKIIQRYRSRKTIGKSLFKRGVLVETLIDEESLSVLEGKVVFVGPFRGYQKLIILDHGKGCFSVYGNLSETFVQIGDIVESQASMGIVGIYPEQNRSLFYFEARFNKTAINPMRLFPNVAWK